MRYKNTADLTILIPCRLAKSTPDYGTAVLLQTRRMGKNVTDPLLEVPLAPQTIMYELPDGCCACVDVQQEGGWGRGVCARHSDCLRTPVICLESWAACLIAPPHLHKGRTRTCRWACVCEACGRRAQTRRMPPRRRASGCGPSRRQGMIL